MNRPFYPVQILNSIKIILPKLGVTFGVVLGTVFFGLLLSILIVRQKYSKYSFWRGFAATYIHILRCTPSIVLLFIVFYGIPKFMLVLFDVNINFWPKMFFVIIALTLLYSAQLAEIIRSALEAIGPGQFEAGISIGLTNLGNSLIALLKEGSLAFTIGLIDVMGSGNLIISRNYGAYALETYIALAIVYWGLTLIIERTFCYLEKRYSKGVKHA